MKREILVQGEAKSFAFFHVSFPVMGERRLHIGKCDVLEFTIGRRNRKPIITKRYPGEIEREINDTFVVALTATETAKLPCLLYRMQLTLDIHGHGEERYTVADKELEVVAK
ncbi:MAG: hypothetical protein NC311_11870 [Muribaculaceae bacterium]|nr:hypothetical protein [Muribaculaceae bacterium]